MPNPSEASDGWPPNRAAPSSDAVDRLANAVARLDADGTWLVDALTEHILTMRPVDGSVSRRERRATVVDAGAVTAEAFDEVQDTIERGGMHLRMVETWLASARATMSVDDTKVALGIDDDELVRRVEDSQLIAIKLADRLRFPNWQFDGANPPSYVLRGLPEVLAALAMNGAGWQSDAGFMNSPKRSLVGPAPQSPSEWLRTGGSITLVLEAIESWGWA